MTTVPEHDAAPAGGARGLTRLAGALRHFWQVMCATHHERLPS